MYPPPREQSASRSGTTIEVMHSVAFGQNDMKQ
jgi:hypothetical protein